MTCKAYTLAGGHKQKHCVKTLYDIKPKSYLAFVSQISTELWIK